jgi:hypothetical protein
LERLIAQRTVCGGTALRVQLHMYVLQLSIVSQLLTYDTAAFFGKKTQLAVKRSQF